MIHPNLFSQIFLSLILFTSSFINSKAADEEFTYTNGSAKGPENWWHINPDWKICGDGKLQSPIDILKENVRVFPQLGGLQKDYKPAHAVLKNMGHNIMLQWNGDAGKLNIKGTYYKLLQCHWHTPSEHTLNGSKFDLELHIVHKNSEGELAVIGIWYKIGRPDVLLSKLLNHLKSINDGKEEINLGVINPGIIKFGSRKYYRYVGSLTTPPCTEAVTWTILNKVRTVSREQVRALKEAVHHGFEENARPRQELNGRPVWLYTP